MKRAKHTDPAHRAQRLHNESLPPQAERHMEALQDGHLRPALYYTQQEQTPCKSGVWESPRTVRSKLKSKEEFPQG